MFAIAGVILIVESFVALMEISPRVVVWGGIKSQVWLSTSPVPEIEVENVTKCESKMTVERSQVKGEKDSRK